MINGLTNDAAFLFTANITGECYLGTVLSEHTTRGLSTGASATMPMELHQICGRQVLSYRIPHQRLEEISVHLPLQRLWPLGHPASSDQLTERRRLTLFVGLPAKVAAITQIDVHQRNL